MRAREVGAFLNISTRQDEWPAVIAAAERHPDVWASVGVHPHEADSHPDLGAAALVDAARHPRVSALVPCYNAAEFLDKTLDCLARQTWPNLEILIADDCSTDATPRIVEAFVKAHPNVRVLPRSRNLGWLENSNDLMANATGEYCFFAFHDDLIAPTYVEKLVAALDEEPEAILAYSHVDVADAIAEAAVASAWSAQHR